MEYSLATIGIFNFILVWLLPWIFFKRDGKKNLRWFLTAFPFMMSPIVILLTMMSVIKPVVMLEQSFQAGLILFCTLLHGVSIYLIALTIGTHRIPVALWHQNPNDDKPVNIVTWGAYAKIRHPFYSAFIMACIALFLGTLNIFSLLILLYVFSALTITAKKEEKRLSSEEGELGKTYREYMSKTNRFFPFLI